MAEKDTYLAIENAVEQLELAPATVQETHKLKSLRTRLRNMSMLLKEFVGEEHEHEPEVADWLHEVRKLAYEAQDVIDSIIVEGKRRQLGRLLSGGKPSSKHVEEIQNIEKSIEKICSFKDVVDGSNQDSSFSFSFSFNDNEVVGFQNAQETVVRQIIDDTKSQLGAFLIYGKPGSGKTTLAKMVCNDDRIKKHFGCLEWVSSFPHKLSLVELLCRILRQRHSSSTSNQIDHLDELKAQLSENLKSKCYLIVIDNIQNSDDALDELMSCFPHESKGSRLLLTRRVTDTEADSQMLQRFPISYEVQPLDVSHSWQLLSMKVLKGKNNPELESLGKRMAHKCKGSPRAILALAAILDVAEKTQKIWLTFLEGYDDLSNYSTLPRELQLCLLYFGLFPEDSRISAKQIIQMWVAGGYVKQQGRNTVEEIGEHYLNKLISDSFIHVDKKRANGSIKTCYAFSHVYHLCKTEQIESWIEIDGDSKGNGDYNHALSLHWLNKNESSTSMSLVDFRGTLRKFHHLRVLNLGFPLKLEKMDEELGKLRGLRYLKLKAPNVKYLPPSIVNLQYLETLDMRNSPVVSLPKGIWKLKLLRHLYLGGPTSLPKTHGIEYYRALSNLQTLSGVTPDKDLKWLIVRAKFPNVTKLRICSTNQENSFKFLNSLDHLYHLQSLRIENPTQLPDHNAFPLSLTKLTLMKTELPPSCIKTLEMIPNLRILQLLTEAICKGNIECSAGGFSQLEVLLLENLKVKKLTTTGGAMQCVECVIIKGCDNLEIPDNLRRKATFVRNEENGTP